VIEINGLLKLFSVPGIGSNKIRKLINEFGSPDRIFSEDVKSLCRVEGIEEKTARRILTQFDASFTEKQLDLSHRAGAAIVTLWDSEYPALLKAIHDPPILLFVKGSMQNFPAVSVAVVGMRLPTQYGRWAADHLSRELARSGVLVVSGMARGIDTCAHRGAIESGGKTIAVLGSGVDVIYPPENRKLAAQIAENGAVISEFPMGTEPDGKHFPRRNRIISGLSHGTVVVEAGEKSGALITASMALDQGREVFAVPGQIRSKKSQGSHSLIKEGAKLVEHVDDILLEFPHYRSEQSDSQQSIPAPHDLSETEQKVWDCLSEGPLHIDQIAFQAKMTTQEALTVLLTLELKSCVRQMSGMLFVR